MSPDQEPTERPAITGACRCGSVRYRLALDALPRTYTCHCRDCQTWSGSAFSQQTFLPEEALSVSGPLVIYELTNASGRGWWRSAPARWTAATSSRWSRTSGSSASSRG